MTHSVSSLLNMVVVYDTLLNKPFIYRRLSMALAAAEVNQC